MDHGCRYVLSISYQGKRSAGWVDSEKSGLLPIDILFHHWRVNQRVVNVSLSRADWTDCCFPFPSQPPARQLFDLMVKSKCCGPAPQRARWRPCVELGHTPREGSCGYLRRRCPSSLYLPALPAPALVAGAHKCLWALSVQSPRP